jgi:hypothetical protein
MNLGADAPGIRIVRRMDTRSSHEYVDEKLARSWLAEVWPPWPRRRRHGRLSTSLGDNYRFTKAGLECVDSQALVFPQPKRVAVLLFRQGRPQYRADLPDGSWLEFWLYRHTLYVNRSTAKVCQPSG